MVLDHDTSLVVLNNAIGNREAEARARSNLFCGEKWIKDACLEIRGNPWTAITHAQLHIFRLYSAGNSDHFVCGFCKCVARIGEQIQHDLFQLDSIAEYQYLFRREL